MTRQPYYVHGTWNTHVSVVVLTWKEHVQTRPNGGGCTAAATVVERQAVHPSISQTRHIKRISYDSITSSGAEPAELLNTPDTLVTEFLKHDLE